MPPQYKIHRTVSCYTRGKCRCERCRAAWNEYYKGKVSKHDRNMASRKSKGNCEDVSEEQILTIFKKQRGKCPICREVLEWPSPKSHLDHCHSSGRVRGILHNACNRGLGFFKDDVKRLQRAIIYLNAADS